ncbi:MAG: helix-turn-helix domain-containing protein [Lachnospiraceae bacterium]|nr:helix-turn-helix domain-containing protein [Lachnospiraceae bacterium]
MDKEKIGEFISVLRKERHLTQKELADELGLTDKAISKWERGLSYPDISMLEPIANFFEVSVMELLKGERVDADATITVQEAQLMINESLSMSEDTLIRKQNKHKRIVYILSALLICFVAGFFNVPYLLYTVALVMIALPGISFAKRKSFIEVPHDRGTFKQLFGLYSVVILLHQLNERMLEFPNYGGELIYYRPAGTLLMGFFFFFLGYEAVKGLHNDKDYLKRFPVHRIGTLLCTFYICNFAYIFVTLMRGDRYPAEVLIKAFIGIVLLNDHMWFLVELLLLYTVFYIVFRFLKKEFLQYGCMLIVILSIIVVSFLAGHDLRGKTISNWLEGEWWYNTILLFFVGMMVARHYDKIIRFLKKWFYPVLIVAIVGFFIFFDGTDYAMLNYGYWTETVMTMGYFDKAVTLAVQFPMIVCFTAIVFLLMMKIKVNNRVLDFMGEIGLCAIMMQNTMLLIFEYMTWNQNIHIYCAGVIAATLVVAIGIYKLRQLVFE